MTEPQIRISGSSQLTAQGKGRYRLSLNDAPSDRLRARLLKLAGDTPEGRALQLKVEGHGLTYDLPALKSTVDCERMIGDLIAAANRV